MTDLVERLREFIPSGSDHDDKLVSEAADEIERLLRINEDHCKAVNTLTVENSRQDDEIERLRAALQAITVLCKTDPADPFLADNMARMARAALTTGNRDD